MPSILDQAVSKAADGTWGFQCPNVAGNGCGEPGGPGFSSTGWPDKKTATARGQQHFDEHKGLGPMPELAEFRAEHGLAVDDGGNCVKVEDL